jgi:Lipid A core - O-antigen ligase and related enzymes
VLQLKTAEDVWGNEVVIVMLHMDENRLEKYLAFFIGLMACGFSASSATASIASGIGMLLGLIFWSKYKDSVSLSEEIKGYMKAYGIFLLLLMPSIAFSDNPAVSINEFFRLWIWRYIVFVLIVLFINRKEYLVNMLTAVLAVISVDCLFTFVQVMTHMTPDGRGGGFHRSVLVLGAIMCMVLPMAMVILMDPRFEKKLKKVSAFAAISVLVGLLCNKSRGAWLTELIVIPIATFRYLKQNKKYLAVVLAVFLGIAGFMASNPRYVKRVYSITNTTTNRSNVDRIRVWKSSKKIIRDHPVTGVGLGRFSEIYLNKYKLRRERQNLNHAHNNFIQITAESGFIGLAGLFYFAGYYLYKSLQNYRKNRNPYDILVFTTILEYICLFGQIDYSLGFSNGMRIMWFLLAVLLKMKETEGKPVSL